MIYIGSHHFSNFPPSFVLKSSLPTSKRSIQRHLRLFTVRPILLLTKMWWSTSVTATTWAKGARVETTWTSHGTVLKKSWMEFRQKHGEKPDQKMEISKTIHRNGNRFLHIPSSTDIRRIVWPDMALWKGHGGMDLSTVKRAHGIDENGREW